MIKVNFKPLLAVLVIFLGFVGYLSFRYFFAPQKISINEIGSSTINPQYIFVRKDNTCSNCYNWNGYNPDAINMEAINEIFGKIGTKGTDQRKVGIGVLFFYNSIPLPNLKASLQRLLDFAYVHDFPVFISLDGFQWWDSRPDLWNWWDPNAPGYNPANKDNVEWSCPDNSCAITKSLRNWGSEMEVKPHPNLGSPTFINANKASLNELLPIIVNWHNSLPANKKWLLGGIALGTEIDIGGNYYNHTQLGYAAIKSLNLPGGITQNNINTVVTNYLSQLDQTAIERGIPPNKIFNHIGGADLLSPFDNFIHPSASSAVNNLGNPGWSFYSEITYYPQNFSGLTNSLDKSINGEWASPEWLTYASDTNGWANSLRATLNYRNNRFLNVANWEGIRYNQSAIDAIRIVANETPSSQVLYLNNYEGRPIKGTSDTVYKVISGVRRPIPDWDTFLSLGFQASDLIQLTDPAIASYPLGDILPSIHPSPLASSTSTPPTFKPGDLNTDGKVDIFDYNLLVSKFGNPYTIFDYNNLVANYGK